MYYNLNWPYSLHTAASVLFVSRVSLISHKNFNFELAYLILIKIKIIYYFCNDNYEVLSNNLIRVIFFSITYSRYKNNWSCSSVMLYTLPVKYIAVPEAEWPQFLASGFPTVCYFKRPPENLLLPLILVCQLALAKNLTVFAVWPAKIILPMCTRFEARGHFVLLYKGVCFFFMVIKLDII